MNSLIPITIVFLLPKAGGSYESVEYPDINIDPTTPLKKSLPEILKIHKNYPFKPEDVELLMQSPDGSSLARSRLKNGSRLIIMPRLYEPIVRRHTNDTYLHTGNQEDDNQKDKAQPETDKTAGLIRIEVASRAVSDTPSNIDLLGFSDYAKALADFIKNEHTGKPLTIGIDAPWGMGKTTLMKLIRKELGFIEQDKKSCKLKGKKKNKIILQGQDSFPTVWFNAWKYDKEESLWAALVLEILTQIRKQISWKERVYLDFRLLIERFNWKNLSNKIFLSLTVLLITGLLGGFLILITSLFVGGVTKNGWNFLYLYIRAVGFLGIVSISISSGKEILSTIFTNLDLDVKRYMQEPNYKEQIGFLAEFEDDFRRVVNIVTQDGKWPLVIFIDDLDRCAPAKSVDIFEAINILLDSEHCVFIIGMDSEMIIANIETKYKDLKLRVETTQMLNTFDFGRQFLEKIVQINFRIPQLKQTAVDNFILSSLSQPSFENIGYDLPTQKQEAEQLIKAEQREGKPIKLAVKHVQKIRPDIKDTVISAVEQEIFAKSFDDSEEVRNAIQKVSTYLESNPRKLKRFINSFRLLTLIANRRNLISGDFIQIDVLASWLLIMNKWPIFFDAVYADNNFLTSFEEAVFLNEELQNASNEDPFYSKRLTTYKNDPKFKQLLDSPDFIRLFKEYNGFKSFELTYYFALSDIANAQRK